MPAIQQRNDEQAGLLQADFLTVDDRNVAWSVFDGAGNTFTSEETQAFNQTRINMAPALFSFDGSVLTLMEAGIYQMAVHASVANIGGTGLAEASIFLQQDPATGVFATLPGMSAGVYVPAGANWRNCGAFSGVVLAGANYRYRVRVARVNGADTLALPLQGSGWTVVRLVGLR